MSKPNVIFIFGDQWRAQATGYFGNSVVQTPNLDALAAESINFTHAVSGCPVCTPYRASLLTGQYPLTHGLFLNDAPLSDNAISIAQAFAGGGYDTAYIGKWHVDGHGRSNYIPPERRQGFDYWKVLECTHAYNESKYYAGNSDEQLTWDGYDALAQTADAVGYVQQHADADKPFLLMLSWGPPHTPYDTAPEKFQAMYRPDDIVLRPNVPADCAEKAKEEIAGYYAHCSALDCGIGQIMDALKATGIEENTILVFTSDHGDMLHSHGHQKKQRPWDESIRVPFLLRYPGMENWQPRQVSALIDAPDIMPTLLGLAGLEIPATAEGINYADFIRGGDDPSDGAAMLNCMHPFGQWNVLRHNGKEYRGLRTDRYTYVRDLNGPWLLYDNKIDSYQMENLVDRPEVRELQQQLDAQLQTKLEQRGDEFLHGMEYVQKWGYTVDETGTISYTG